MSVKYPHCLAEWEKIVFKHPFYPLLHLNWCYFTIKVPSSFKGNTAEKHNSASTLQVSTIGSSKIHQMLIRV